MMLRPKRRTREAKCSARIGRFWKKEELDYIIFVQTEVLPMRASVPENDGRKSYSMWVGFLEEAFDAKDFIVLNSNKIAPVYTVFYCVESRHCVSRKGKVKLLAQNTMAKSTATEWASPIASVPKKYKCHRFCFDSRNMNAAMERDSYHIFRIDKGIDLLGEAQMFLALDANSWLWQIDLDTKTVDKTAFITHHRLFHNFGNVVWNYKNSHIILNSNRRYLYIREMTVCDWVHRRDHHAL